MPHIISHINLANRICELNKQNIKKYHFTIGTIAPDAIDFNNAREYKRSHFVKKDRSIGHLSYLKSESFCKNNNKSYCMGYHLHLWFDETIKSMEIKNFLKSGAKELNGKEENIINKEILAIDSRFINNFSFSKMKAICNDNYKPQLIKMIDEIYDMVYTCANKSPDIKYIDPAKYSNYIDNLALNYIKEYL